MGPGLVGKGRPLSGTGSAAVATARGRTSELHLAQFNVARMRASLDSPVMVGFVARLEEINALADRSPGFVWRLQAGNATDLRRYGDDRILIRHRRRDLAAPGPARRAERVSALGPMPSAHRCLCHASS